MARYPVYDTGTNIVKRIVVADSPIAVPLMGAEAVGPVGARLGDIWNGAKYNRPQRPAPPEPTVTARDVDAHAEGLINDRYPSRMREQAVRTALLARDGNKAIPAKIKTAWTWTKSVEDAADALKVMDPIPQDYADPKHWPA